MMRLSQSGLMDWIILVRGPRDVGGSEINIERFTGKKLFLSDSPLPFVELHHTPEIFIVCSIIMVTALIVLIVYEMEMKFPHFPKTNGSKIREECRQLRTKSAPLFVRRNVRAKVTITKVTVHEI